MSSKTYFSTQELDENRLGQQVESVQLLNENEVLVAKLKRKAVNKKSFGLKKALAFRWLGS